MTEKSNKYPHLRIQNNQFELYEVNINAKHSFSSLLRDHDHSFSMCILSQEKRVNNDYLKNHSFCAYFFSLSVCFFCTIMYVCMFVLYI